MRCLAVAALTLLQAAHTFATGEFCHGWRDAQGSWRDGFQCPERYDTRDAITCCGTCQLRYCCASGDARLDQGLCDNDKHVSDNSGGGESEAVPIYVPFLIVGAVFLAFVLVGSAVAVCCCRCLRPKRDPSPGRGGARGGGAEGHLLETIPMIGGASRGSSSRQSSTAASSSSSAPSTSAPMAPPTMAPPPLAPPPILRAPAALYAGLPAGFSLVSCAQAPPLLAPQGPFLHPQYLSYAIQHEPLGSAPTVPASSFCDSAHIAYRPLQSPVPPTTTGGGASEQKLLPHTV